MCTYIPPENSPYYTFFDIDNDISALEDCLTDSILALNDMYLLLAGDWNSRTDDISDNMYSVENIYDFQTTSCPSSVNRRSEDKTLNMYGKHPIEYVHSVGTKYFEWGM